MPNMDSDDDLLTVDQVAGILNLSPRAVRHRALAGTIPATKLPGRTGSYVFRRADVVAVRDAEKATA